MQLRHVMLDLETLDTIPSTKIVAIGGVMFDPNLRKFDANDRFYMCLDHKAQEGRTIDPDPSDKGTRAFWKRQSAEVREQLKGTVKLEDALGDLAFWLPDDCKVWGNGATFDISILEDAYRQYGIEIPWKYYNIMDVRTVKKTYEAARGGWDKKSGGTLHHALDDAQWQAEYVTKMWNSLIKG